MAKELVGLIGVGRGPQIAVPHGSATIKVKGLTSGLVVVRYECGEVKLVEEIMIIAGVDKEGSYAVRLPRPIRWVEFECIDATGQPICSVRVDEPPKSKEG